MIDDSNLLDSLLTDFVDECRERLQRVTDLLVTMQTRADSMQPELVHDAKREMHTLKGNSGIMGFEELRILASEMETQLKQIPPNYSSIAEKLQSFEQKLNSLGSRSKES